jgi:hypothetical protein
MPDAPPRLPAALRLPDVQAEHLDAVLRAAGTDRLRALAVLCHAIGWIIARTTTKPAQPAVHEGAKLAIARAISLQSDAWGQG